MALRALFGALALRVVEVDAVISVVVEAVAAGRWEGVFLRATHAFITEATGDECFMAGNEAAILSVLYGENELALACLERSFERRGLAFQNLRVSSLWDPLRDDPRFEDLIRRMNYPDPL